MGTILFHIFIMESPNAVSHNIIESPKINMTSKEEIQYLKNKLTSVTNEHDLELLSIHEHITLYKNEANKRIKQLENKLLEANTIQQPSLEDEEMYRKYAVLEVDNTFKNQKLKEICNELELFKSHKNSNDDSLKNKIIDQDSTISR